MKKKKHRKAPYLLILSFFIIGVGVGFLSMTDVGLQAYGTVQNLLSTTEASALKEMQEVVEVSVIYPNIFINEVDVSGLTAEEALTKLQSQPVPDLTRNMIILTSPDGLHTMEIPYGQDDVHFIFDDAVEEAFQYARMGSTEERFEKINALTYTPLSLTREPQFTYINHDLQSLIAVFGELLRIEPVNATIEHTENGFVITPEIPGTEIDLDATVAVVEALMAQNEDGEAEAILKTTPAEQTAELLNDKTALLGTFYTKFTGALTTGRNINLQTALSKIDGSVVYPGEVFSTAEAFGPSTHDNGYRLAPVIINGRFEEGMGGGICQVSSTLYKALLFAELEIVERQNHSRQVNYIGNGFDATLSGKVIDLKFRNNTDFPVFIVGWMEENKLYVSLYGHETRDPSRRIEFESVLQKTVDPPDSIEIEDPNLPRGQRVVEDSPVIGRQYRVFKIIYEDDVQVDRVHVNNSNYRTIQGTVRVGTGAPVVNEPPAPVEEVPDWINNTPDEYIVEADIVPPDEIFDFELSL